MRAGSEPIGVAGQQPRSAKRSRRRGGGPLVRRSFLLPSVLLLLTLSIFPLVFSLALSVGSWVIGREEPYQFLGATNFTRLFTDARYLDSLINTLIYAGGSVVLQFGLGLGLAWLLFLKPPGSRIYRLLFLMPMMLTPVAVAYMWRLMFEQRIGVINYALDLVGIEPISWLTQRATALTAVVAVETWQWTPFIFVFLYAAMENLPQEVSDAARVDGANRWQILRHVITPMIAPIAIAIVLLRAVEALKVMDSVYVMTGGGPGNSTESVTLYAYRAGLQFFDLGYAAAMALTLFIGALLLTLPAVFLLKKERELV